MARRPEIDDVTKQAAGRLFYDLSVKLNDMVTKGEGLGNLGLVVKTGKAHVSTWLDNDDIYQNELATVEREYHEDNRPEDMDPREWLREKRIELFECISRAMHREGVYKQWQMPFDKEVL